MDSWLDHIDCKLVLSRHRMRIICLLFCYYVISLMFTLVSVSLSCQTLLFQIIQIVQFENVTQQDEMYSISVDSGK